jgi:uncharacterized phage protein gp47/JayE
MPTYGVTTDGFVRKPLSAIRKSVEDYQRANIDAGLDLSDQSTRGQENLSVVNEIAELWELAEAVYNSQYPDGANGFSLDEVCSITGTSRDGETKTTVTGQVTLNPFKNLPAGSVAHLASQPTKRFITLAEVPAADAGGTFSVAFEAEDAGAIQVEAGQLDTIAEAVSGWTAVTNAAAGATGSAIQTDSELRLKRESELQAQGSTNVNAIRADLIRLEGVEDARVLENVEDVIVGGLLPHSIYCVLRGGTSAEVAQAIFDTKAAGIETNGSESENVTDSQGITHPITFDFATEKVYYAGAVLVTDDTWDAVQGPIDVKAAIAAYINSLVIGGDVVVFECICACLSVTGVTDVTSYVHDFSASPATATNLAVADSEFASSDVANITVS